MNLYYQKYEILCLVILGYLEVEHRYFFCWTIDKYL